MGPRDVSGHQESTVSKARWYNARDRCGNAEETSTQQAAKSD